MSERPALLVSLHDVSPLTFEESREALALVRAAGLRPSDLTVLVIPLHEGRIPLDQHRPTVRWLEGLVGEGATLTLHGLTHRMRDRLGPAGWPWGYGFARGQGELYRSDGAATERCLEEGLGILERAGLRAAVSGFVPPAWLLSRAGLDVVQRSGLAFYELLSGIAHGGKRHAGRLIGWGSLTAVESLATSLFASWQARRAPADTRLAIHPADLRRSTSASSVKRTLARMTERFQPASYARFLRDQSSPVGPS